MSTQAERVGDVLLRRGDITHEQLLDALYRQLAEQSPLGRLLVSQGTLSRRTVFSALADCWALPFVDLVDEPPDASVVRQVPAHRMLDDHWVPMRSTIVFGDDHWPRTRVEVATAQRPTPELEARVRASLDADEIVWSITTDWDVDLAVFSSCEDQLIAAAAEGLSTEAPDLSAKTGFRRWQRVVTFLSIISVVASAVVAPQRTLSTALIVVNVLFLIGVGFKAIACLRGMRRVGSDRKRLAEAQRRAHPAQRRLADEELPVYTILVPAFREANIVSKLIDHICSIEYPQSKLQILLLLEADDTETIAAARDARPPDCVRFVIVPPGGPQTKPKACNVGLALAEGEYLVIYDAEDIPERMQLRDVLEEFRTRDDSVVCLQARLNYYNWEENILTRMFTLEYSSWFDYMLPGLDSWSLPIPLGGTSNHFRVSKLRELGGWDPYNVTEDADLGIRAAAEGMTVGIIDSTTWEEACSSWWPWIRQRTRWIKGYMVTSMVHTRRPLRLLRTVGTRGVIGLVGLIAGTPAMFLAAPVLWAFWLYTFLGGPVHGFHLDARIRDAMTASLVLGNGVMIALTALAARRRNAHRLIAYALLLPAYWVLHSIAAWRALWQLVRRPDHWEKTPHGIVHGPPARLS